MNQYTKYAFGNSLKFDLNSCRQQYTRLTEYYRHCLNVKESFTLCSLLIFYTFANFLFSTTENPSTNVRKYKYISSHYASGKLTIASV